VKPKPIKTPYSRKELNQFRQKLLGMRDRMSGQISALKNESLNRRDKVITEEDGTDTFDRDFALNLASSEQDAVFEIDEALRRIEQKTYGICEISGAPINRERLDAIPYVRLSVRAQEQIEKGIGRARMKSDRGLLGIERIDSVSMTGSD
jgi:RNA polymerase-binding transcription factor DksA